MSNNTNISVIIPVYNAETYLDRSIESVVSQSYTNLEIILVDDGSTDRSAKICKNWEFRDNRIIYIRQENAGSGIARNTGVSFSKSDYITFLDADDWFEHTFVEDIIETMQRDNSEVGQCDIFYIDSETNDRHLVKLRYDDHIVSSRCDKTVVNKSRLFSWGKIYKRNLFDRCKFSFSGIVFEDTCIALLIACANQISYVPKPLINYFRNRPSSQSNDYTKIGDLAIALQLLYDKLNELNIYREFELEYKKITLGQFRFACRKWGETEYKIAKSALIDLEDFIGNKFPELRGVSSKKYFAFGSQILNTALDNAVPYRRQLLSDISGADCIIAYERDMLNVSQNDTKIVVISNINQTTDDTVSAAFNIAELIMEKL